MGLLLTTEAAVIQGALAFANLPAIGSTAQVERLFEEGRPDAWRAQDFKTIAVGEAWAFENDQKELRRWLDAIITRDGITAAASEIKRRVTDTVKARAKVVWKRDRSEISFQYQLDGVQACYSLAAALLMRAGMRSRLGRCRLDGCATPYFFDDREGTSGRRKTKFCSPAHANADKVRRWRAKQSTT